jgi:Ca2+-binding EF-hand superfamily protein
MDRNGDGLITFEEFGGEKKDISSQLKERKRHAEFLDNLFHQLDSNGDGRVSHEEYFVSWNEAPDGTTLKEQFKVEDLNSDGYITPDEFGSPEQQVYLKWQPHDESEVETRESKSKMFETPEDFMVQLQKEIVNVQEAIELHQQRGELDHVDKASELLNRLQLKMTEVTDQYESGDFGYENEDELDEEPRSVEELKELITIVEEAMVEHETRGEEEHVAEAKELLDELQLELQEAIEIEMRDQAFQDEDAEKITERFVGNHREGSSQIQQHVSASQNDFSSLDADQDTRISRPEHSILLFIFSDRDKNGLLTRSEFRGPQGESSAVPDLFSDLDIDGSNSITFEEFSAEWHTPPDALFENDDSDKDGFITLEEFRSSTLRGGDSNIPEPTSAKSSETLDSDKAFSQLDQNGDNGISFDEFLSQAHIKSLAASMDKTEDEAEEMLSFIFDDIDKNKDDIISPEEHRESANGPSEEDASDTTDFEEENKFKNTEHDRLVAKGLNMFDLLDINLDEVLDEQEFGGRLFGQIVARYWSPEPGAFIHADANANGEVDKTEFPGRTEWSEEKLFDQLDFDNDGKIAFEEFDVDWHKIWIGRSGATVEQSWDMQDADKNNVLRRSEFIGTFVVLPPTPLEDRAQQAKQEGKAWEKLDTYLNMFALCDIDNSDDVSLEEFKVDWHASVFAEHNTHVTLEELFHTSDVDFDNLLSKSEFPGPTQWSKPTIFDHLDEDMSGDVSLREYMINWHKIWLTKHGITANEAWKAQDSDGNRILTREEFFQSRGQQNNTEKEL